jgi:ribonuclease VapC
VIAVDTSALMAIALGEAPAEACINILETEADVLISAGTVAEALIVAGRRNVGDAMAKLLEAFGLDVVTVTPAGARRVADAYERWGKGVHPAGLNFGDCFAYAVAKEHSCPLLFVGEDFSKTDLTSAL